MSSIVNIFSVSKIRELHERYEAHISAVAVLTGFIVDSLTLQRIDLLMENIVIIAYLVIAGAAIVVMNLHNQDKLKWKIFEHADWWVPLVMQFAFGGLFSVFLLFYGRAGSLLASWPLFLVLIGLMVGNEMFRTRYQRFHFHVSVWYVAVFAYLIFAIPLIIGEIGSGIFLLSGLTSLLVVYGFVSLLTFESPDRIIRERKILSASIGSIFLLVTLMYFLNIIPPIPLSLQEGQVAHSVERQKDTYQLSVEKKSKFWKLLPGETVHIRKGDSVSFYSAVFGPTDFNAAVVHEWQRFNGDRNRWEITTRIGFPIYGGSERGYRGYSVKQSPEEGLWRVSVETPQGLILGRDRFRIDYVNEVPELKTIMR